MATSRSLGLAMMRQPVTPQALQPKPMAMVRLCRPQGPPPPERHHPKGHPGRSPPPPPTARGERRKERGGGAHHRYHPRHRPVDAVHHSPLHPPRRSCQQTPQWFLQRRQPPAQQPGGGIGPLYGQVEHQPQQQKHHRKACKPGGQQPIQPPVRGVGVWPGAPDALPPDLLRQRHHRRRQAVPQGLPGERSQPLLRPLPQGLFPPLWAGFPTAAPRHGGGTFPSPAVPAPPPPAGRRSASSRPPTTPGGTPPPPDAAAPPSPSRCGRRWPPPAHPAAAPGALFGV